MREGRSPLWTSKLSLVGCSGDRPAIRKRQRRALPGGNASPLDPSCAARNSPAPICKLNLASGKHAEQPHNNKKLHNHKMHPRRQAGAAAQPTMMPICDNGQRF